MPAKPKRRSLVIKRARSPFWYCDFQVNGRRFRDCLGTESRAEAETIAARLYAEALEGRRGRKIELSLEEACARYLLERGQYAASAPDIERHSQTLMTELGSRTFLSDLTTDALAQYVARRRMRKIKIRDPRHPDFNKVVLKDRANGSINREVGHLRTVLRGADAWGAAVPKIDWRRVLLDEPENVQTILTVEAEDRLFAVLRPDYWPLVEFALLTGVRLENAIGLRWDQVDWDARTLTFRVKSRKPGRKLLVIPITDAVAAVIAGERGRHAELVFTYESQRNRFDWHSGATQRKGERYPFSHDGWRKAWETARVAAGLPNLRFHDLRHTAATRALVAHKNLRVVQKMLGHADIATTVRYTAAEVADVREAMEAAASQFRRTARLVATYPIERKSVK